MKPENQSLLPAFFALWKSQERRRRIALIGPQREITYPELHDEVGTLAGKLRAAGILRGARVAIAMERTEAAIVALLAVLAAGAVPWMLEPNLGGNELRRRLSMTRIAWLLLDDANEGEQALEDLPTLTHLKVDELSEADPYWDLNIGGEAPALLLFTSGSSGKPKGVLQSHRGVLGNASGVAEATGLQPDDRLLHIMPLFHTNGINNQILAPLLAGASIALAGRFRAENMPDWLARYQPTIVTGVPTIFSRMLPVDFPPETLTSVRMLRCGSAPITEEQYRRVEQKFGKPLVLSYGLSEATCTSTLNPPAAPRLGSVGRPLPGQRVEILDSRGVSLTEPDSEGEVCISGPTLMLGYIDERSGGLPQPPGLRLASGDLGYFDQDGYLFLTGRKKEVIIRGGENISPGLIESVLIKVPGVDAVCVVAKHDADLGEVPFAFVVKTEESEGKALSSEVMSAAVESELSRIHRPAGYQYLDRLPENSVGKVDRKRLAESLADL